MKYIVYLKRFWRANLGWNDAFGDLLRYFEFYPEERKTYWKTSLWLMPLIFLVKELKWKWHYAFNIQPGEIDINNEHKFIISRRT